MINMRNLRDSFKQVLSETTFCKIEYSTTRAEGSRVRQVEPFPVTENIDKEVKLS